MQTPRVISWLFGAMCCWTSLGFAEALQTPNAINQLNPDTRFNLLATLIAGILTMLATQWFSLWREARNRRWDLENRELARQERAEADKERHAEIMDMAIEVAKQTMKTREEVLRNTAITTAVGVKAEAAYEAANNFTERIGHVQAAGTKTQAQLDAMQKVEIDTNLRVTDLQDKGDKQ